MSYQSINLGPIDTSAKTPPPSVDKFFNNVSLPPVSFTQFADDAVQTFFEKVTGDTDSAKVLASAVVYTSASQGTNPMATLSEFRKVPVGELNEYLAAFLNLNRVPTSLLGINNQPQINQYVKRTILV